MINWKSILSSFNDKPTLLEWLKLVEKALKESVLKDVTINQNGGDIAFTFNFEDGTSVTTPKVTLPKGDKGDIGEQGISVTRFDNIGYEVVGEETLNTIRANYSDSSFSEFIVNAKNGKSGGKLYLHKLNISIPGSSQTELKILSNDSSKITRVTNEILVKMISGLASNSIPPVYSNIYNVAVVNDSTLSLTVYNSYPFDVASTHNYDIDMTQAQIQDKVTEL